MRKQLVYDEEIRLYKGVIELKRLKLRKQKDDIITIWKIAKKHKAGFELVKRWYKWNGVEVPDDYLHQCIEIIEKYQVQSLEQLEKLLQVLL